MNENTNNFLQQKIEHQNEIIKILKNEVDTYKPVLNSADAIIKTSMSTVSFIIQNYNKAPQLKELENYSIIKSDVNDKKLIKTILYHHKKNTINKYLGEFIIKSYKKQDPTEQSVWNSDASRLTYIIRELLANDKLNWCVDKKGIRTCNYIIEPVLKYIQEILTKYMDNISKKIKKIDINKIKEKMYQMKHSSEIINSIKDKKLANDILKYITPHFYLNYKRFKFKK